MGMDSSSPCRPNLQLYLEGDRYQRVDGAVGFWLSVLILNLDSPPTQYRFFLTRGPQTNFIRHWMDL